MTQYHFNIFYPGTILMTLADLEEISHVQASWGGVCIRVIDPSRKENQLSCATVTARAKTEKMKQILKYSR